jgi:hypothetical protein
VRAEKDQADVRLSDSAASNRVLRTSVSFGSTLQRMLSRSRLLTLIAIHNAQVRANSMLCHDAAVLDEM